MKKILTITLLLFMAGVYVSRGQEKKTYYYFARSFDKTSKSNKAYISDIKSIKIKPKSVWENKGYNQWNDHLEVEFDVEYASTNYFTQVLWYTSLSKAKQERINTLKRYKKDKTIYKVYYFSYTKEDNE